jgi:hypothetical protein
MRAPQIDHPANARRVILYLSFKLIAQWTVTKDALAHAWKRSRTCVRFTVIMLVAPCDVGIDVALADHAVAVVLRAHSLI